MEFTPEARENLVKLFEGNVEKLCSVKESVVPEWWLNVIDKTSEILFQLKTNSYDEKNKDTNLSKIIENSAVKLWNHIVPMKTQGSLSNISNAKLRHICFMAVTYSGSDSVDDAVLKRQTIMGMKTARAWIECNQMEQAEIVLNLTHQCVEKLKTTLINKINAGNTSGNEVNCGTLEKNRLEVDRDILKILTCKAEVASAQMQTETAINLIFTAKEMLARFPREGSYMSMLCYNFGVDTFQRKQYEESVTWLKESYELGKGRQGLDPKNQARTLRFLANVYLEWNEEYYCDKAMNAITLANTEYVHPAGLYLKLRVLLLSKDTTSSLNTVLSEIIKHPDCTVDLSLNVIHLMRKYNRYEPDYAVKLLQRYENSTEFGKMATAHLEALLSCKLLPPAKDFTEQMIIGHNTGRVLESNIKKQFQHIFWEQAATDVETNNYDEALQWYNYSLSLFSPNERQECSMAKLHRNRASCLISLGRYPQAEEILGEAIRCDDTAAATYYLLYKLALLQENKETAITSIQKMVSNIKNNDNCDQSIDTGLICLAAQLALKENSHEVASVAMECFINSSKEDGQVLVAIRCLLRLQLSLTEDQNHERNLGQVMEKIHQMILLAYNKLLVIQDKCDEQEKFVVKDEALWFMKIAWNMGLKCKEDPKKTKEFFTLCYQLLSLCEIDINTASRQKTCIMMASFACLQLARHITNDDERKCLYEECLHHVNEHRQQTQRAETLWATPDCKNKDYSDILLLLCEFESRVKLDDPQIEQLLDKILSLPQPDPKTFEIIAALSIEAPANNKSISIRALKVAIRTHLQSSKPDYDRCSKDIHSLIQMSICNVTSDNTVKEEVMNYYKETCDVIENKAKEAYPEMEILWLMTKAWNCGIHFYRCDNYTEAERWCGMALHFLSHLTTIKNNYEEKMNTVYGEILENLDKAKPLASLEE